MQIGNTFLSHEKFVHHRRQKIRFIIMLGKENEIGLASRQQKESASRRDTKICSRNRQ